MIDRTFLQRFRVDRLLSEGGMGQVYIAHDLQQDRDVVVKVLRDEAASDAQDRECFRREIQVLRQFQHPYVVEFYGGSLDPGGMFLVMEYVRGTALNVLLEQSGRFPPERVGKILAQLCDVLQAAHSQGIVHCDIKPANLMIVHPGTPYESIKLMDFGVAKIPTELSLSVLEMESGKVMSGTPHFMAPEQVRAEQLDHRADIYSVGIVLYQMLTGRLPFERPSPSAVLSAQKHDAPPSFAESCPESAVPRPIEQVVQKCLAKHPEQRPSSANDLAQLYEKALGHKIVLPPKRTLPPLSALLARLRAGQGSAPPPPPKVEEPPEPKPVVDPNAGAFELRVRMPESMAMLKLRGFVQDLGGQIVEGGAPPGVVRVRLRAGASANKPWAAAGSSSWSGTGTDAKAATQGSVLDMELRIQRPDPKQPDNLSIALTLRAARNSWSISRRELKDHYDKIFRDLKAYLHSTISSPGDFIPRD